FVFGFDGAYLSKWDQQANPLVDTKNYVGLYEEWNPTWRLRANASLDWTYGDFGASWMTRYMSSLVEECAYPGEGLCSDEDRRIATGPAPRNRLPSTTYHDVQFRYAVPWNGVVKLGVNNIFKKNPPYSQQAFANSFDPQYDIPDSRYMYLEYTQRF